MIITKLKLTLFFTLLILVLTIVYVYIKNYTKNSTPVEAPTTTIEPRVFDKVKETEILTKNSENLKVFSERSTIENQSSYIKEVNTVLASSSELSSGSVNALLLRKALVLSALTGSPDQDSYIVEAISIFKNLISLKGETLSELFFRDFAIIGGTRIDLECCFSASLADETDPQYVMYKNLGYRDQIAKVLALNELSKKVSANGSNDISHISNLLFIDIILLGSFREDLRKEEYEVIYKEMEKNLAAYKNAKPIFFTDAISTIIQPSLHYAVAYDAYNSQSGEKIPLTMNKSIDANYELASQQIKELEGTKDPIMINKMRFYHLVNYISSLQRRYGTTVDKNKVGVLIEETLQSIRYSKETEAVASNYLKPSEDKNDRRGDVTLPFISLAKTYPNLAAYLKSIGVE